VAEEQPETPQWRYVDVGRVEDVVRLAADGQVPSDGTFGVYSDETSVYVTWYGFAKSEGGPACWANHQGVGGDDVVHV
jgi:hypothetical protein